MSESQTPSLPSSEALPPLQQLMYGLLYPAVLGTGIVLIGVRAAHHSSTINALLDPAIQLGVMAGLFFCASFDAASYWPGGRRGQYTSLAFAIDFVEVIIMFICFHYLRLFEDPVKLQEPFLPAAYLALMVDVVLQFFWRGAVGIAWKYRWRLRASVAAVLLLGSVFGSIYSWVNPAISVIVGLVVVVYVIKDPRYNQH